MSLEKEKPRHTAAPWDWQHIILESLIEKILSEPAAASPTLAADVPGMISPKVRLLLNRCVAEALPHREAYLEIGSWRGASLISALLDNTNVSAAYACDNFSEPFDLVTAPEARGLLRQNIARYSTRLPASLMRIEMDCWELATMTPSFIERPVGVYFYDGDHSEKSHARALTEFAKFFSPAGVIVLVDDWNWDRVRRGTWKGIEALRPAKLWFRELPAKYNGDLENFWNGVGAFHLVLRREP